MSHPFTSQRRTIIIYSILWLFVAVINAVLLRFSLNFSLAVSLAESFLESILFGLFGLILWYPIRYIPFRKNAPVYSVMTHVLAGMLLVFTWLFLTVGVLGAIFSQNEEYNSYLENSLFWRGFVGLMFYLVMVLVYYLVSYSRSLRERAQAEEKLRTLVKESELNMLKSQINPHFLFNSLNSISSLINKNPEEAREMIIRLSDFLRYSLKHRENKFVTLEEEIVRMKDYLSIEKVRFGDKLKYELNLGEKCGDVKVPTMILQPLVENAIKHGVYESLEPVSITFMCAHHQDYLKLQLINDYDPDQPVRKGTGVGLQNVSERLRLAYDGRAGITRSAEHGIFEITMIIPIDKD